MASRLVGRFLLHRLLSGRIVCSAIQAAVQDRTALLSARFVPLLRRVWRLFLLTPFCLSPLFFLPVHFLLALFERDAHGSPQSSASTPSSLRVVGLPARFARLAGGLAVILVRESAVAATTAGASDAAIIARRALALGSRFVDLKVVGLILFRRDRQWPSLPRRHWAFSTKAKPRARPVSRSVTT